MKGLNGFLMMIFVVAFRTSILAQNVIIEVPAAAIFNRVEFATVETVMNTGNRSNWEYNFLGLFPTDPIFISASGSRFRNISASSTLPNTVLVWQLATMGGRQPATGYNGGFLDFQSFKTASTRWFAPPSSYLAGGFRTGLINFLFKIPAEELANNSFYAGNYAMTINQNYDFSPRSFDTIISIPAALSWLTTMSSKYIEVTSLNDYRSANGQIISDLGNFELGNTVDFKLYAKSSSSKIDFLSSKGKSGSRNISAIRLGSAGSELNTKNLTANFQDFSSATFSVKAGNRNKFTPQISVSAADFRNYFFEAGLYTFQLNFDARSTNSPISTMQSTEVTVKVPPLAEISLPASGKTVNFDFNTAADYSRGQTKIMPNQLKLSNNENYVLSVKSDENYFRKAGVQTSINSNILQIGVDGGRTVPLSTTLQKIITGGTPVLDKDITMKYSISSAGAQTLVGQENAIYTLNVIYSFTAL